MLREVSLVVLLIGAASGGPEVNGLVDRVLAEVESEIRTRVEAGLVRLPDFSKSWNKQLWNFKLGGKARCEGGKVTRLGPFRRAGEVITTWYWNGFAFKIDLLFREVTVSFDACEFSIGVLKFSDPLRLKVSGLQVSLEVVTDRPRREPCRVDGMEIRDFGGLEADMGPGVLSGLKEKVLEYYANRHRSSASFRINLEDFSLEADIVGRICRKLFHFYH